MVQEEEGEKLNCKIYQDTQKKDINMIWQGSLIVCIMLEISN